MMKKIKPLLFQKKLFFPKTAFSVAREKKQPVIPPHKHDFGEIGFIIGGSAIHITENEETLIKRGDVFVVYGDCVHGFTKLNNLHILNILFDVNKFDSLRKEFNGLDGFNVLFGLEPHLRNNNSFYSILKLTNLQLKKIQALLRLYEEECCNQFPLKEVNVISFLKAIVIQLCRDYSHSDSSDSDINFKIEKIVNYIKQHFHEKITFEHLVDEAGMSATALRCYFKITTGYSPIKFLMRLRVAEAAQLLVEENIKVKNAGKKVGFHNQSYFVKTFREIMGVTPKEYSRGE
jgi:AraC-like DNA-binding protein